MLKDFLRKFLTKNTVDVGQALTSLKYPGEVITANISTTATKVGESNILKIHVTADTYVAFGDDSTMGAVTPTTSPAVLLPAGMHYVLCQADYIRASANPTRIELLKV